jgi:hypothetical protein
VGKWRFFVSTAWNRSSSTSKLGRWRDGGAYARFGLGVDGKALISEELVNKFEIEGRGGRLLGWGMSQPGDQITVNGGFTMISRSFIIIEQLQENRRRAANPVMAVFLCSVGITHASTRR